MRGGSLNVLSPIHHISTFQMPLRTCLNSAGSCTGKVHINSWRPTYTHKNRNTRHPTNLVQNTVCKNNKQYTSKTRHQLMFILTKALWMCLWRAAQTSASSISRLTMLKVSWSRSSSSSSPMGTGSLPAVMWTGPWARFDLLEDLASPPLTFQKSYKKSLSFLQS